jgi:hypothetical protein
LMAYMMIIGYFNDEIFSICDLFERFGK